ncbi:MAG: ABC transporter ATP-binding protein [Legionellaceae bacterium]|nr:ABC transporter ATP-binding protein [Legionellaceae bacterium]
MTSYAEIKPYKISKFIWEVIKPYRWWLLLIFQATFITSGFLFLTNFSIKLLIDAFSTNTMIVNSEIILPISLFISVEIGHDLLWRLSEYAIWHTLPHIQRKILVKTYDYVQYHSFEYFQSNPSGSVISQLKGIYEGFYRIFENLHTRSLRSLLIIAYSIVSLLIVNTYVFLFMFIWSIVAIIIMYPCYIKLNELADNLADSKHEVMGLFSDNISNIFSIFNFSKRKSELNRLKTIISRNLQPRSTKLEKYFFILSFINSIIHWVMLISVFLFMVWLRKSNKVNTGDFVFVIMTILNITEILWAFTGETFELMKDVGDFKSSFQILKKPHNSVDNANAKPHKISKPKIEFRDVSFGYNSDNVINHLNLTIPTGQKIGLVGCSGAGKSTLISLLLKSFSTQKGHIFIDDQSLDTFQSDSLRSQISLIPQDIILFNRSIGDNIAYSKDNATLKEIKEAASFANIDKFIESLPDQYDTAVGERGLKLSGGQRQRIAIARAILKKSKIIILDEATSNLDTDTEQKIQKSIAKIIEQKDTTVITVAHRLSSIKHLERIIVLDKGEIMEDGTFDELLAKKNGLFKGFWDHQINGFINK